MTTYNTLPDVSLDVDTSTGPQMVHTPWGMIAMAAGDMIVPYGDRAVPIPGALWRQWFAPVEIVPEKPPFVAPDKPFNDWERRELEQYAREVIGENPPYFPRKTGLAKWVEERAAV